MTSVPCSIAGRPVPSKMRAPVNAVVPPCAWTAGGATAYDQATQTPTRTTASRVVALSARVDMRVILNSSPPPGIRSRRIIWPFQISDWIIGLIRLGADDFRKRRPRHRLPVDRHDLGNVELQSLHQVVQARIGRRGRRRRWVVSIKEGGFDEHALFREIRHEHPIGVT